MPSRTIASLCIVIGLAATAARAQTEPAGRTDHDLVREIAEFDRKFIVEAYEKHGHRDPAWDAAALKLVRAQYEASIRHNDVGRYYAPTNWPETMDVRQRVKLANEVIEAGCDDAMVLFLAGKALVEAGEPPKRYDEVFTRAEKNAAASQYIPLYKLLMFKAAMDRIDPLPEGDRDLAELRARFRPLVRQTLSDPDTLPKYRAVVWSKAAWIFEDQDNERVDRIASAVADVKNPDPWLFATYMGAVEIRRAWKARGGDFAHAVTERGWEGFRQHLALAREHLERAAQLEPTLPHPAALMITVCLGESSPDAERWFREATRRQIDHAYAYNAYRSIVHPKWGGSIDQQLNLAARMITTDRFDTRVPGLVLDVATDMAREADRPLTVDELGQIAPLVEEAMAGYDRADHPQAVRAWARSTRVVWLYLTERFAEAHAELSGMTSLDERPAMDRDLEAQEMISHIHAMVTPEAAAIAAAMSDEDADRRAKQLSEISARLQPTPETGRTMKPAEVESAMRWVRRRLAEATFEASLKVGEWTPLPLAEELAGWQRREGKWSIDGDTLVGTSDRGMTIIAPFQMPARFEFRCTVEVVGDVTPAKKSIYVFCAWSPNYRIGGRAKLPDAEGSLIRQIYNYGKFPLEREGDRTTLRFRYDNGRLSAIDESGTTLASADLPHGTIRRPAFGGTEAGNGAVYGEVTWRFSDIAVRALE